MNNKDNKKKFLILVGILLLVVGISYAYFAGVTKFGGTGSSVDVITSRVNGATITVSGTLEFNDLDILPGHKNVSSIKLTATGNNEFITYNLIWNGINSLNTPLNYTVYKTTENQNVKANCEKKQEAMGASTIFYEECAISNMDKLGDIISKGTIETSTSETKEILVPNEFVTATSEGTEVYYYVILEYPNLEEEQNADMGGSFSGIVTVEESTAKADINIVKIYANNEEVVNIPKKEEGLILDEENSTCTNNAKPIWDTSDWSLKVQSLSTSGTDCNLYFTKSASSQILADITPKESPDGFTEPATTDEGVFKAQDDDGETYYWRGAVTNNYVKFADKYWRIIRINGDGTIRLIYDGETARANGSTLEVETSIFNTSDNNNMYAGFKYTSGEVHGTGTESTILGTLNTWYETNLKNYEDKIDLNAGFCNDREPSTSSTTSNGQGGTGTTATYYGALIRFSPGMNSINNPKPTFKCKNSSDLFTKITSTKGNKSLTNSIGLITIDEVVYAGGHSLIDNQQYYLYTGQQYWTMTPFDYSSSGFNRLRMYIVHYPTGRLSLAYVNTEYGVRPVINLKADTKFKYNNLSTKGTMDDPYVVE